MAKEKLEHEKVWLETLAQQVAGRRLNVVCVQGDAAPAADRSGDGAAASAGAASEKSSKKGAPDPNSALKEQAMADPGIQALLEVFPAEIRDVEEM
jgi:ribosomal protein L12E/L44/L45/RPP1/RPP2